MQALLLQSRQDEAVDGIARPPAVFHLWDSHRLYRNEGPVWFELGALLDPPADERDFVLIHAELAPRRGHPHCRVVRCQTADDFTSAGISRFYNEYAVL